MIKSFTVQLVLITLLIAGAAWLLLQYLPAFKPGVYIWYTIGFFFTLTYSLYHLALMGLNKSQRTFSTAVFGSMTLRFIFSLLFLIICLIISKEKNISFIVSFLLLYLFYTIFEIVHLVRKLRAEKSKGFNATNS